MIRISNNYLELFRTVLSRVSLVAQLVKNPCGRPGSHPWVGKIPWRRERLPTPVFWPGEFQGLHSPWGRKESDTTERLSLSLHSKHFTPSAQSLLCFASGCRAWVFRHILENLPVRERFSEHNPALN